jgi:hypothetical protein
MNLVQNPTKAQLKALLFAADDNAAHHVLWVDKLGEVHLDPVSATDGDGLESPKAWLRRNQALIKLKYETYAAGLGYVGPSAAQDHAHIDSVFSELVGDWAIGERRFPD